MQRHLRVLKYKDVFSLHAQHLRTPDNFHFSSLSETVRIAAAETQYFDMIAMIGIGQCLHGRSEKHGFIVRVGCEQNDTLTLEGRERVARHVGSVEPEHDGQKRGHDGRGCVHGHFGRVGLAEVML